jgi:YggT family protein
LAGANAPTQSIRSRRSILPEGRGSGDCACGTRRRPLRRPAELRAALALLAVIIAGIIVLSLLGVVRDNIILILRAAAFGPRALISVLVGWTIGFLQLALIVRVITSWVRISPYSRWVRWSFVLTDWLVRPLRKRLPNVGMFDISPIVAYAILWAIGLLLQRVL